MERDVLGENILQHEDVQRTLSSPLSLYYTYAAVDFGEKKECDDIFGAEIL